MKRALSPLKGDAFTTTIMEIWIYLLSHARWLIAKHCIIV